MSLPSNPLFTGLVDSNKTTFTTADAISEEEIFLSNRLSQDAILREVAMVVKRAGAMLIGDINKKVSKQDALGAIEELVQMGLLSREYVVICRQTSNQINRMSSLEALKVMTEAGVLCSCGELIAGERIDELFSSTEKLQKMLNQSYWTTAKLVSELKQIGVKDEQILLNLHQGPEEIDAFVDLEGTLLMFELKDNEFSLGHAYPFGGRIGLYKPEYAIIVATMGVAPDVREYFKQIKPQSTIVYVDHLDHLRPKLLEVLKTVRTRRASQILSEFESVTMQIFPLLASKLGVNLPKWERSYRFER